MPPTTTKKSPRPTDPLPTSFYTRPADAVAPDLLGRFIIRTLDDGTKLIAQIIETEAYLGSPDRASHAHGGRRTPRNQPLYQPGGCAYVYFIYGMYECFNIVTGTADNGDAVLIRAAAPIRGEDLMLANRRRHSRSRGNPRHTTPDFLMGGPGKLCQALLIDRSHNLHPIHRPPLQITAGIPAAPAEIRTGPRIGIDYAGDARHWPLRFALAGHPAMSRPILR